MVGHAALGMLLSVSCMDCRTSITIKLSPLMSCVMFYERRLGSLFLNRNSRNCSKRLIRILVVVSGTESFAQLLLTQKTKLQSASNCHTEQQCPLWILGHCHRALPKVQALQKIERRTFAHLARPWTSNLGTQKIISVRSSSALARSYFMARDSASCIRNLALLRQHVRIHIVKYDPCTVLKSQNTTTSSKRSCVENIVQYMNEFQMKCTKVQKTSLSSMTYSTSTQGRKCCHAFIRHVSGVEIIRMHLLNCVRPTHEFIIRT